MPLYFQKYNEGAMIRKQQRAVFTFHTTTDAMAMESLCKEKNLGGRMIPVP